MKKLSGDKLTKEQQARLDEVAEKVIDLEEQLEIVEIAKPEKKEGYQVPKGTENLVHLSIVRGEQFDPNTGKEISEPYIQMFTFGEAKTFKERYKLLGYVIKKVLHDPYGIMK